jgi:hypothetical protein
MKNRLQVWKTEIEEYLIKTASNKQSLDKLQKGAVSDIALLRMSMAMGCSVNSLKRKLEPEECKPKPRKPKVKR